MGNNRQVTGDTQQYIVIVYVRARAKGSFLHQFVHLTLLYYNLHFARHARINEPSRDRAVMENYNVMHLANCIYKSQ